MEVFFFCDGSVAAWLQIIINWNDFSTDVHEINFTCFLLPACARNTFRFYWLYVWVFFKLRHIWSTGRSNGVLSLGWMQRWWFPLTVRFQRRWLWFELKAQQSTFNQIFHFEILQLIRQPLGWATSQSIFPPTESLIPQWFLLMY